MIIQMPIDAGPDVERQVIDQFSNDQDGLLVLPLGWNVVQFWPDLPEYVI